MKMLARNFFFVVFSIMCLWLWSYSPIILSIFLLFSIYQVLFFKYSTIIVFQDKILYQLKNLVNFNSTILELHYNQLIELSFSKSEIDYFDANKISLIEILFPSKENEVIVFYANGQKKTLSWRGNVLEVQIACEKANEIIKLEYNRPRF